MYSAKRRAFSCAVACVLPGFQLFFVLLAQLLQFRERFLAVVQDGFDIHQRRVRLYVVLTWCGQGGQCVGHLVAVGENDIQLGGQPIHGVCIQC